MDSDSDYTGGKVMDFDEYQYEALRTAIYPNRGNNLLYTLLGLGGEVGEVLQVYREAILSGEITCEGDLAPVVTEALQMAIGSLAVLETLKKAVRDDGIVVTTVGMPLSTVKIEHIAKELGDVLWYLAAVAEENGFALSQIGAKNIEKLRHRRVAGTLQGSGDDR